MINKLLDNCFQTECNTIVTDVEEDNGLYWHAFKETIFFMEKGGMASDIGVINGLPVLEMRVKNGKQWHLLDQQLNVGDNAFMGINLHERFRKCQVHTTQHLISALLCNIYKVHTISHHVSDDENEIEFDFENFTDKMASELMVLCNGLIRDDLEVNIQYPSRSEAARHVSEDKLNHDDLRVVRIGNLDYNLCGCMHVPSLRYLQMVYITGYEKTTRGYKVKYICGDQLLDCMGKRYKVLNEASHTLALSHLYINTGINKLINDQKSSMRDVIIWKQKYFEQFCRAVCKEDQSLVVQEFEDMDVKSLAQLAQYMTAQYHKACVLLTKIDEKCHVVVAAPSEMDVDCRETFKTLAETFIMQGGGSATLAQGGGVYTKELSDYIKSIQKL